MSCSRAVCAGSTTSAGGGRHDARHTHLARHGTAGDGRRVTLGAGRAGLYDLDFNRAYHPYCHFNPGYECPVPPRENRLMVAVRAGEKLQ